MKVIWVLENIKFNQNSNDYYVNSKLNILLLLASVNLWRKYNPEDTCTLYGDSLTLDTLDRLKVLDFWHQILLIPKCSKNINKNVFWASSKLQVLSSIKEHVIIMDNDTHFYRPIKKYLNLNKVYFHSLELADNYYPSSLDVHVKKLSYRAKWGSQAANVSFLNLPDYKFTNKYAELSLQMMEDFSSLNVSNTSYLIFSEQLLLKHLLDKHSIEYAPLISTYWDCSKQKWGDDHNKGVWKSNTSDYYLLHYGILKSFIKDSIGTRNYPGEIRYLLDCINLPNLDLSSITNK